MGFSLKTTDDSANEYTYKKNILGDIIGIYDGENNLIVKYSYDAWGNHKIFIKNDGKFVDILPNKSYNEYNNNYIIIANLNPFRYRGYYYDAETGLYYLNSRYYDPEIGRFINADDISNLDLDNLNGLNLYTYCFNNPANDIDADGTWSWKKFWKGLGMIATAITAVALAATTFGAGIPVAMGIVAGVTLAAGILTGINGVATLVEAGTDYNFVRDGLFNQVLGLSDNAYNWYSGITEGVAVVGSLVLGVYHTTGHYKAAKASQQFLGKGYTKAGSNRWVSADGLRQVRWDTTHHMYNGVPSSNHFNWYTYGKSLLLGGRNKPITDVHVWIKLFKFIIGG